MMGYGASYGCNNGGGSSSSSSNLSASAPPFTVDRSVAKPLLDLTEPTFPVSLNSSLHNWVTSNSHIPNSRPDLFPIPNPEFDSVPSPLAFGYSSPTSHVASMNHPLVSASTDAVFYGQGNPSIVEAEPYYPSSYISPAVGSDASLKIPHQSGCELLSTSHVGTSNGSSRDDYTQSLGGLEHTTQWSGLWEGVTDWHQNKKMQLDGGDCAKENFTNQGFSAFKDMNKCKVTTLGVDRQMHTESASIGQLDYKAFLGEKPKLMAAGYSTPLPLVFPSVAPQAYPQVPSSNAVNSPINQMLDVASYGKSSKKHDASPNDSMPVMKSSPAVVIRPPGQDTYSFENMNTGRDGDEKDFAANNPSSVQELNPFISSEGQVFYDSSQINFHLKQNDDYFAEISSKNNEELPSNKNTSVDFLDQLLRAKMDNKAPCRNLDFFNLAMDGHEAIGSVENTSESSDHYNPAVDSPCWKGAPVSRLSAFEVSEVVNPQILKKVEVCNGLGPQGPQISSSATNDAVNACPEKQSNISVPLNHESVEHCQDSSFKRPLVANVLFREEIDDVGKYGPYQRIPSYCHEAQISDVIDERRKESILSDFNSLHTEQRSLEEGEWLSKKNSVVADARRKINDDPDDCSSHVPFHAIEQVLCSPPSPEHAPAQHTQSQGGELLSKMHARTLVDTMHNLSELLLFYSSNYMCDLKDEDFDVLKDVINNLNICISKNLEKNSATQESSTPQQVTSQFSGMLYELYKGQLGFQYVEDEKEHKIASDKRKEKLSNWVSVRVAADTVKHDNMTQAIKKLLAENFPIKEESESQILLYKNLWLEAESSLCSVNYMSRFNRMKIEMEKGTSRKANVVPGNPMVMENLSRTKVPSDILPAADDEGSPVQDVSFLDSSFLSRNSHSDDVMTRFHILKSRVDDTNSMNTSAAEKLSSSKLSPDPNQVDKLTHDTKDSTKPNVSIRDFPMSGTSSHADNVSSHADNVLAGFHNFKCWVDSSSCGNTSAMEKLSSSKVSPDLNKVDKLAHDTKDISKPLITNNSKPLITIQDSPMAGRSSHADDVVARFRILKGRVDNSNSVNISAMEKLPSSKVSSDPNKVGKLTDEAKDSTKPDITKQDSPLPSTSSHAEDIEAAVMARLLILKHGEGYSSSLEREEHQPESIDIGYTCLRRDVPMGKDGLKDSILDVNMAHAVQNYAANSTEDKTTVKEFRLFVDDDAETQSRLTNRLGDQPHTGWYDSCSSDWEHVLKEEIAGHGY